MSTASKTKAAAPAGAEPECFVVMPISEPDGYATGHFLRVFEDIIVPGCQSAGFKALRADQVRETNLIHLDVLQRLLNAPMVICDLSSRNPNVLFELGLRQAFDMPVVLIQEVGTPKIFDIAPLRFTEYRPARVYHEVLEDQRKVAEAISATRDAVTGSGVNSIVKILALTKPAALPEVQETNRDPAFQIIRAELNELRQELRFMRQRPIAPAIRRPSEPERFARLSMMLRSIERELENVPAGDPPNDQVLAKCNHLERMLDREMRTPRTATELEPFHTIYARYSGLRQKYALALRSASGLNGDADEGGTS